MSTLARRVREKDLQAQVLHLAALRGWMRAHFRPAMNSRGQWRTAVAGDARGFPDLVLVRDRVIFVELKSSTGRLTREQRDWQEALTTAGADHRIWTPDDWPEIEDTLQ